MYVVQNKLLVSQYVMFPVWYPFFFDEMISVIGTDFAVLVVLREWGRYIWRYVVTRLRRGGDKGKISVI